ncbi:ATP-binding cassette domain-containing protein [uncultured Varibaculum sp.]|uniref:ATP-binding cassette domain-containing protein n=1 Tax=uncultured Varibaculum sp. TaxID=413896 RepID=UPI0025995A67|nr:ATP-binding cassette domain-containing protein [uncultured Varibaculum sp.]
MNNNQPDQPATPEEFHRYQKPRHATPPAPAAPPAGMPAVKTQVQRPATQKAFPARQSGNVLPRHTGVPQAASPLPPQVNSYQGANPALPQTPQPVNPTFAQASPPVTPAFPQSASSTFPQTQASAPQIPAAVSPQQPPLASPQTTTSTGTPLPQKTATTSDNAPQGAPVVSLNNVYKIYRQGETEVRALDGIDLQIYFGQFTAIVGPSGSGKSTLLHCLAGLDSVTKGTVQVAGKDLATMNDKTLTQFRRDHIGFVFQSFNLMPTLTALENIRLPQLLAGKKTSATWENQIIEILNLKDRLTHKPSELSGGQQQRVAVARALITKPALLVADEPTGNLDSASSQEVLKLLRSAASELGQSVVMVTHDPGAAAVADRVLIVKDGKITQELSHPTRGQLSQVI